VRSTPTHDARGPFDPCWSLGNISENVNEYFRFPLPKMHHVALDTAILDQAARTGHFPRLLGRGHCGFC